MTVFRKCHRKQTDKTRKTVLTTDILSPASTTPAKPPSKTYPSDCLKEEIEMLKKRHVFNIIIIIATRNCSTCSVPKRSKGNSAMCSSYGVAIY